MDVTVQVLSLVEDAMMVRRSHVKSTVHAGYCLPLIIETTIDKRCVYTRYNNINQYKNKITKKNERKVGMEYQKKTNKGSKDSNKGQGSSLLLCVLSLPLFISQALEIVILISF